MKRILAVLAVCMAACSPPPPPAPIPIESGPHEVAQAPAEVLAAISAELPGFAATNAISDNSTGAQSYRIAGTSAGTTYDVRAMLMNEGWRVVSIRRDIAWENAPPAVAGVAAALPEPARVVENRELGADGVIYELYEQGADTPSTEIRLVGEDAAIMPAPH